MDTKIRSIVHVIIQFSAIIFILVSGPVWSSKYYLFIPELLGISLVFWAVWIMRKSVLSVMPDPQIGAKLIENGAYRFIRHPMYSALFLVLIPLVINQFTWLRFVVLILFGINQILKMIYEEQLLKNHWPGYVDYVKKTWRLIPYLY
jgi:protein-S-isoprenylcysteine O-methyltransferase Ste14